MDSSRRTFIHTAGTIGLAGALAAASSRPAGASPGSVAERPTAAEPVLRTDPFTLGVASGDPSPDGFVIWTRLAPEPLAPDGLGGMPSRQVTVQWEVATDSLMRSVVQRGVAAALPEAAHSVHVELSGLEAGREFWYRFRAGSYVSRIGRALTAPRLSEMPSALAMAFASCSQFEHGWFTAYRRLAEDHPDLVLHLGDYQYEYRANRYIAPGGNVRHHDGPETVTLANYRQRHAQYKTDPDLQEAHAVAPWLVVWDDHELDNNWADEMPENIAEQGPAFLQRRADAFQAYYENMPLRRTSVPAGIDLQLYRRVQWGQLATFHMLDTRQYRDDQACGDGYKACATASDPSRSITGEAQERWLLDGFRRSDTRWDVLGQQVFFAQRDRDQGPLTVTSMDAWDGYTASRDRITRGWLEAGVRNPVVLTGDVHAHWAADLKSDYADPTSATVGTELVCSSITSGGDGADAPTGQHPWAAWNPHLRFWTNLRGYVNTTITPEAMRADYRCVPRVSVPGAEAFTRTSFAIEDRRPGLVQTADNPLPAAMGARTLRQPSSTISDATVRQESARP